MSEEGYKVTLHAYDLSQGLARQLSTSFLGKSIEAIWHTGIVVYGNEYYFGAGIQSDPVGRTPYGTPLRVIDLGVTHVPQDVFEMYLQEINPRYTAQTYSLLKHNCNNFSNEVAQFLVGSSIPDYILNLPNEVMSSPMGAMMLPMIQNLEMSLRAGAVPQAPQFRPSAAVASSIPTASTPNKSTGTSASITPTVKTEVEGSGKKSLVESAAEGIKQTNDKAQPGNPSDKAAVTKDPLGDARGKIQEEITKEFAAIMQSGMYRASEAAALATRRVMERHGHMNTARS